MIYERCACASNALWDEVRNEAGRTIALQCTACHRTLAYGACPGKCGRLAGILPEKSRKGPCCGVDCARSIAAERGRQTRAVKKEKRDRGAGQVSLFDDGPDVLGRARGAR